jgi:sulfur carrier protein
MNAAITVRLNGQDCRVDRRDLIGLLRARDIDTGARGIAVAVNGAVVPRRAWDSTALKDGDAVEVVKLFAGG